MPIVMRMKPQNIGAAALLALGAVLAFAPVATAQTTNPLPITRAMPAGAHQGPVGPLEMMKQSLSLSDEQARKLEPVLKEQQEKINTLRRDTSLSRKDRVAKLKAIQQGTDAKIKAQLTPAQAEKWQQVRANPGRFVQQQGQNSARTNAFSIGPQGGRAQPALPTWQSRPSAAAKAPAATGSAR